jgi:hypothetical protein
MPLKLNSAGGGSVTLDVPSTASNFTLTTPVANGSLLTTDAGNNLVLTANSSVNNANVSSKLFVTNGASLTVSPYTSMFVNGPIQGSFPRYTVWVDTVSASVSTIAGFTKSYQSAYPSFGSIREQFSGFGAGGSVLYQMNVHCTSATTVTTYVSQVDDNLYFFLNGTNFASITTAGNKNNAITWNFISGNNSIQIIYNNSGGGGGGVAYWADYFYTNSTTFFVA